MCSHYNLTRSYNQDWHLAVRLVLFEKDSAALVWDAPVIQGNTPRIRSCNRGKYAHCNLDVWSDSLRWLLPSPHRRTQHEGSRGNGEPSGCGVDRANLRCAGDDLTCPAPPFPCRRPAR